MSLNKNNNITQNEINGIITIFKQFEHRNDLIEDIYALNELEDCSFEFKNTLISDEELIFEQNIDCEIIPDLDLNLGQHYYLIATGYEYDYDEENVQLKQHTFELTPIQDNLYRANLTKDMFYMTGATLHTKYDNKIITPLGD